VTGREADPVGRRARGGRDPRALTADLGGRASTREVGDTVLEASARRTTTGPTRGVSTPSAS